MKPASTPSWTPDQLRGIRTTGRSLLVSAAAGSGKTAVLAARCAHLVCDAVPPCEVHELLVVTFTEAAAAEMKGRIEKALRARLASVREPDARLERQLAMVERASVSTLHGFCSKLIRQNFHLLGLDPGFQMLDGDEQQLLRAEVARAVFAERHESDSNGHFARLIDIYAGGDDERLIPRILRTYEMLCSLIDPAAWIDQAMERLTTPADPDQTFEKTTLGAELVALVRGKLSALQRRCAEAVRVISSYDGLGKYVDYVRTLQLLADDWADLLSNKGLDALSPQVLTVKLDRKPTIKGELPGKELASSLISAIQETFKKGDLHQLASFTVAEWRAGLRSILPSAREFLELVTMFGEQYRAAKERARRLDFNDLERHALKILRDVSCTGGELKPSPVALTCHTQFAHVLVDEYQDINEVQDAILHLVSRECLIQNGATEVDWAPALEQRSENVVVANLFTVGDVKQSIYRFRLAEPTRFLSRDERFRLMKTSGPERAPARGEVIDLQQNFRSRGPLLNCINQVFRRLMTREAAEIEYDASHELRPGSPYPADLPHGFTGAPIELHLLPDDINHAALDSAAEPDEADALASDADDQELERAEREAAFVASRIRELMGIDAAGHVIGPRMNVIDKAGGEFTQRPLRFGDIVILLRSMRMKADQYAGVLRAAGIPVHRDGDQGYFDSMEIRDMRSLLGLLDNQQQDIPFAAVLRSPLAGLPNPEDCLARIRLAYPAHPNGAIAPLGSAPSEMESNDELPTSVAPDTEIPFHRAVTRYAAEQKDELAARLRDFLDDLSRWRDLARHRPLAELVWEIYDQTGYLAFVEGLAGGAQRVANLLELHRRAAQFGSFARQGLYRFLRFLDSLESQTEIGQPSVLSEASDVVRIMSVHHSKGLEFPVVFLPEMGKRFNLQDTQGTILLDRSAGLALAAFDQAKRIRYPSLASMLVRQSIRKQSLAEELRILYVAMTRAKEHLILSGTCKPGLLETWQTAWANYPGAMPAADVLDAATTLDWLGPVAMMTEQDRALEILPHTAEEVSRWTGASLSRPEMTAEQQRLARLEPLAPPPAEDHAASLIIHQLTAPYAYANLTKVEAARSVTAWLKKGRELPTGFDASALYPEAAPLNAAASLAVPRCRAVSSIKSATEIGTATHLALQYLDFAAGAPEPAAQIQLLVTRKLLTAVQGAAVDLAAVHWFLVSEVGRLISEHASELRREFPFTFAIDPAEIAEASTNTNLGNRPAQSATYTAITPATTAGATSHDRVMIRGRIDALLPTPMGLTLIDYKTDRVTDATLATRVDFYRPQVTLYRRALHHILRQPITKVALVFLHARAIVYV